MKNLNFKILVKKVAEGKFIAVAPSIPNCSIEASSEEEAIGSIQEAIAESIREKFAKKEEIYDDQHAMVYNLTIEIGEKPSA